MAKAFTPQLDSKRFSLEAPCGLPSPSSLNFSHGDLYQAERTTYPSHPSSKHHVHTHPLPDTDDGDLLNDEEADTLISCLSHLSVSSLPPLPGQSDETGPVITRFPQPRPPVPSSQLGTREEQRRIYLGPKLSDRATGGPDAGPLIERFSCLFKDRAWLIRSVERMALTLLRISLQAQSKGHRLFVSRKC